MTAQQDREPREHEWLTSSWHRDKNSRFCLRCGRLVVDGLVLWQGSPDSCKLKPCMVKAAKMERMK